MAIIFASPADDGACGNYRVIQPLKHLGESDEHSVGFIRDDFRNESEMLQYMHGCNVFVFQRPKSTNQVGFFKRYKEDPNRLLVFEHDDNTWALHPLSDHFRWHGTTEIAIPVDQYEGSIEQAKKDGKTVKDGQVWIWEHGLNGYDVVENARNRNNFETCLSLADVITTTQPKLAKLFEKEARRLGNKSAKAYSLPNCLDLRKWNPVDIRHSDVRIVWQGGASHQPDLTCIQDALRKVLKDNPNVTMIFGGCYFPGVMEGVDPKQIEVYDDWVPFETNPYKMAFYGADINIVPIEDNYFNSFKSDIKFTEASALSIPTVASNLTPYKESIRHGETGLLTDNTTEGWVKSLTKLIKDAKLRKKLGKNARKWVEENRDAAKEAYRWGEVYDKELKRKQNDKQRPDSKRTKAP